MADLYGRLYRETQTEAAHAARDERRKARLEKVAGLGHAVQAHSSWNIQRGDALNDGTEAVLAGEHPGTRALAVARAALADFDVGEGYTIAYSGSKRSADQSSSLVMLEAETRSASGIKVPFSVPVMVRQGRVHTPSVLLHEGTPYILCQSTFDQLLEPKTFYAPTAERTNMYAPPPSREEAAKIRSQPWQAASRTPLFNVRASELEQKRAAVELAVHGFRRGAQAALDESEPHADNDAVPRPFTCSQCKTQYECNKEPGASNCPRCGSDKTSAKQANFLPREPGKSTYSVAVRYVLDGVDADAETARQMHQQHDAQPKRYNMGDLEYVRGDIEFTPQPPSSMEVTEEVWILAPESWTKDEARMATEGAFQQHGLRKFTFDHFMKAASKTAGCDENLAGLGPADREPYFQAGEKVRLGQDVVVRDRGGCRWNLDSGTKFTVVRDQGEDGVRVVVKADDGQSYVLACEVLSGA